MSRPGKEEGYPMDMGVVIALAAFGFASLLAVLIGVIAAVSAVAGICSPEI